MKYYLAGLCASLAMLSVTPGRAQEQSYETPLYKPSASGLDRNYGLPTFGMQGVDGPKPLTMSPAEGAVVARPPDGADAASAGGTAAGGAAGIGVAQPDTDVFKDAGHFANDFPDVSLPSDRRATAARSAATAGIGSYSTSDSTSSTTTDDTPLYTTSEGMTTGDMSTSSTTK